MKSPLMKRLSVFAVFASLLAPLPYVHAQPGTQSEVQAGDFFFRMPSGWQRKDQGSKTFLVPPSAADTLSTVIQLESFDLGNNDLAAGFNAGWQGFVTKFGIRSAEPAVTRHSPNGFDYMQQSGVFAQNGKTWVMVMMAAKHRRRLETVVFLTSDSQEEIQAYQKNLADLLASIHFAAGSTSQSTATQSNATDLLGASSTASAPAASATSSVPHSSVPLERNPAMPPAGPMTQNQLPTVPGKFSGIFRAPAPEGIDPTAILEDFSPAKRTPNFQFLVLFSDGTAMRGLPNMGLDNYIGSVRLEISGGGKPCAKWGVYRMSGNQGMVSFASPTVAGQQLVTRRFAGDAWRIQEYPDRLDINGSSYVILDSGPIGMKLQGTYKPYGDKTQRGITFTPDGEFVDEGIMKAGATAIGIGGGGLAIGYAFNSPGPGRGTYHVSNYTLHLHYVNSQAPGVLFWIGPESSRGDPRTIYIDNVKFQRVL